MPTHANSEDFDIGKTIFEKLKDLSPERQQRLLRWVSEGLGVSDAPTAAAVPAPTPTRITTPLPAAPGSSSNIKSFVASKAPKSDNQFAAVVAYYYHFEASDAEHHDSIDANQLQEAARLASRKRLKNPLATLNHAKTAGYLDGTARGEFSVNSVGENLVAMTLPGLPESTAQTPRVKKAAKKKVKTSSRAKKD